ncbi:hypothetical protein VNO77_09031 [Canavalia gladiata]|uniref:Uncharacterized protein n=1 Tax=Canavalia gladiata TaxID=3824 RepID=A0AAN9MEE0_CANGL
MVIPLSFPHVVNRRIMCKVMMLSLSIIVLFSSTTYCVNLKPVSHIKSATFVSEYFEVGPGTIAAKTLLDIEFPKGHIGVKSFDAELVDEDGNSVPLYETYLHHWFAIRYFENITMSHNIEKYPDPFKAITFKRNEGTCQGYILPHY